MGKPVYAEHAKLSALRGANQTVGNFIEWIADQGWEIAERHPHTELLMPVFKSCDSLIAAFFEIDPVALENEKRAMLAALSREAGHGG